MEDFATHVIGHWSYLGLFTVLFIAGLGVPLPEDIPLIAAGWLASHDASINPHWMVLAGLAGVMAGDSLMFHMGRRYGPHIVEHRWLARIAKPWLLAKAREKFANHGAKLIFIARFMPGIRSVVFLTAGTFRVPYWKFITFDGTAALVSVPLWVLGAYYLASKFERSLQEILGDAQVPTYVLMGVLATALLAWGLWEYFRYYRRNRIPPGGSSDAANQCVTTAEIGTDEPACPAIESPSGVAAEDEEHAARRTVSASLDRLGIGHAKHSLPTESTMKAKVG